MIGSVEVMKQDQHEKKVVVYAGNKAVYEEMITAAKSLLMHNKIDEVWFLAEHDREDFPYYIPDCIHVMNIKDQTIFPKNGPNMKTRFSYVVLMRAAFHKLFPDYHKILSLDIDTVVIGDITGLWDIDISDYYFAACEEPDCRKGNKYEKKPEFYKNQYMYFNAGVAMYNLDKLRDGTGDEGIKLLNEKEWYSVEQDTYNLVCNGKILDISSDYNSTTWCKPAKKPLIIHYAGTPTKEWNKVSLTTYFKLKTWDEVMDANSRLKG